MHVCKEVYCFGSVHRKHIGKFTIYYLYLGKIYLAKLHSTSVNVIENQQMYGNDIIFQITKRTHVVKKNLSQ